MGKNKSIKVTAILLALSWFASVQIGQAENAQPIAPLPSVSYASFQDSGVSEQEAEADVDKEEEGGELDFLDKSLSEISQTPVASSALSSEVETVSRTTQPLARTPAAVYVVTNDMIKRCGARNIPEVLRTVPGVQVARINASAWAISIRGMNQRFASKLLVQIDGVAIYNMTQSAVFWEREYVMLEDVDRIEVIRGPGASVWGANAVNGVINIITKSSKDTHGLYVDGGGGNEHLQFGDLRVGGNYGNLNWRLYGFTMRDDQGYIPLPRIAQDNPRLDQGGFRIDWTPTSYDTITFWGDFYAGRDGQNGWVIPPTQPSYIGCKRTTFLTRWVRQLDENTDWAFQCYYYNPYALAPDGNKLFDSVFDIDFQFHKKCRRHDVVVGASYRNIDVLLDTGGATPFINHDTEQWPSYFFQDTYTLVEDKLFLTVGSKFDHNSITDFEYQPTIRATWTPNERTSIWGAVSRAVRTPALYERAFFTPESETELSYEVGIRRQPTDRLYWECNAFFSRYRNLMSTFFFVYFNAGSADTYGVELNATYEVSENWHLNGWYTFFVQDVDMLSYLYPLFPIGGAPRNMAYLQSAWDLGKNVQLDVMFRYVDYLQVGVNNYFASDIRLAWQPTEHLELSVVGQNLLAGPHYEWIFDAGAYRTEVEPGVYGMVSWRH